MANLTAPFIVDAMDLTPIDGGFHVKTVDGYCIDVYRQLYNWRLTISEIDERYPHANGHIHGWCYFGHGEDANGNPRTLDTAFVAAVLAAQAWDGVGSPPGADKQAF